MYVSTQCCQTSSRGDVSSLGGLQPSCLLNGLLEAWRFGRGVRLGRDSQIWTSASPSAEASSAVVAPAIASRDRIEAFILMFLRDRSKVVENKIDVRSEEDCRHTFPQAGVDVQSTLYSDDPRPEKMDINSVIPF